MEVLDSISCSMCNWCVFLQQLTSDSRGLLPIPMCYRLIRGFSYTRFKQSRERGIATHPILTDSYEKMYQ